LEVGHDGIRVAGIWEEVGYHSDTASASLHSAVALPCTSERPERGRAARSREDTFNPAGTGRRQSMNPATLCIVASIKLDYPLTVLLLSSLDETYTVLVPVVVRNTYLPVHYIIFIAPRITRLLFFAPFTPWLAPIFSFSFGQGPQGHTILTLRLRR